MKPRDTFYPESAAGGFSRVDGTVQFYTRVNALLEPSATVLDFGAGRGQAAEDPVSYRRGLCTLNSKCACVFGVDIDAVVTENPLLDEARVIRPGEPLPLTTGSVDLVVADFVFEHIEDPRPVAEELARVLKPGGWLCARTPNRWGYVAVAARLIPSRWHLALLGRLQPDRRSADVFPAFYRLNTRTAIRHYFPDSQWHRYVYGWDAEPAYCGGSKLLWRLATALHRVTPEQLRNALFVFMQKMA